MHTGLCRVKMILSKMLVFAIRKIFQPTKHICSYASWNTQRQEQIPSIITCIDLPYTWENSPSAVWFWCPIQNAANLSLKYLENNISWIMLIGASKISEKAISQSELKTGNTILKWENFCRLHFCYERTSRCKNCCWISKYSNIRTQDANFSDGRAFVGF